MDYTPEIKKQQLLESEVSDAGPKTLVLIEGSQDKDPTGSENPTSAKNESTVSKKRLVNKLNHLHFKNKEITIHFENASDKRTIKISALPQPCFGKYVICLWQNAENWKNLSKSYCFKQFEIITDEQVISVPARMRCASNKGVCLELPHKSLQHTSRKVTRYACKPLQIKIVQNGIIFSGLLKDFSTSSFRVELSNTQEAPYNWINTNSPVNVIVMTGETAVYSGECSILSQNEKSRRKEIILLPSKDSIQRFSPRVHRSKRAILTPSPDILFDHPITGGLVNLKVINISGSGLAVEDDEANSRLIPGLIIPALTINFANSFSFTCQAQVLYRRKFIAENDKPLTKCGITFLDVDPNDHIKLLSLLHNAGNKNIYICNTVDTDKLWEFFFDTGFIYPKKYASLIGSTDQIKKTYDSLYSRQSSISRHFTWQKKGEILAHLAMLRFYEKSWLIHHLAARTSQYIGAGIQILNQVSDFTLDSHRLVSSNMDYLLCYFRPEMRFPNHFFGGIAREIKNPRACSLDSFAYMHFRARNPEPVLPDPWRFEKPEYNDYSILENFYDHVSGGLTLNVLDLVPDENFSDRKNLTSQYQSHGLTRERRVYALKKNNCIKAFIMANISDIALNLSDLTNSVTLFIIDKDELSPDIVFTALSITAKHYARPKFPVLVYPVDYVDDHSISYNRIYQLWGLNMAYSDECFKHYSNLF